MADQTVAQHQIHDFTLQSNTQHDNSFQTRLSATFTHESGATIDNLPGFYDGNTTWKIRFSPTLKGTWTGKTASDDPALDGLDLDSIQCTPNTNPSIKGILQIDPENPRRFAWSNNDPCLPLGFEIDWLFAYHQADPDRCYKHIDLIAERGFNYIVTNLYAHTGFATKENDDTRPADPDYIFGPPQLYLFEGTNGNPDHSRLNISFLQDFDRLMAYLHQKGLIVHLMLQVQNKGVNWPARRSPEDDRFWRYIVTRYQAYGNLIWDVGKESKNLLRQTGSHAYTLERMALIRGTDAYHHLVTVHDVEQRNAGVHSEPDRASDFVSDQIHLKDVGRYNHEAIRRLRTLEKPYMNIEYGYELGAETLKTYTGASTAPWQDILKWTWAIYLAGAYPCYYYDNTSWDLIKFEPEPESWQRYRELKDFLDDLPFNQMEADNEYVDRGLCLAHPGHVYLNYLPEGGDAIIDLSVLAKETPVTCDWMDIFTGERKTTDDQKDDFWNGFNTTLENPLTDTAHPCVVAVRVS